MKIAVVTVYDGMNFGSFLQAYAMKSYLEGLGHEVVFVRRFSEEENLALFTTNRPREACDPIRRIWRKLREKTVLRSRIQREIRYYRSIFPYYQEAWKKLTCIDPDQLIDADCLLCGSDEIWNTQNPNIDIDFYTCAHFGKGIPKIAAAISAGPADASEFDAYPDAVSSIRSFFSILPRDTGTQNLIRTLTGKENPIVCDPTLLADKSIYLTGTEKRIIEEPYLFIYSYGLTDEQSVIAAAYAKEHNLKIVSACMALPIADLSVKCSPLEFAGLIKNAECTFTTTFHGTVFSLLFAGHFCTLAKYPKIKDLIETVGMSAHLWDGTDKKKFEAILHTDIDRSELDIQLNRLKSESSSVVEEALLALAGQR